MNKTSVIEVNRQSPLRKSYNSSLRPVAVKHQTIILRKTDQYQDEFVCDLQQEVTSLR